MMQTTMEVLLKNWSDDVRADRARRTITRYSGAVHQFVAWFQEQEQRPLDLRDLTPIALVGYRSWLQRKAAPSTVNTHLCAVRAWCAWLVEYGYITTNPAARVKLVAHPRHAAPAGVAAHEVNALLRAAQRSRHPERDTAIVQMLVQTGMRLGECAALQWGDVLIGEKHGDVLIRAGKGNKARRLPLNASVRVALAHYVAPLLDVAPTLRVVAVHWADAQSTDADAPLWRSQKGGRLSASAMGRMIDGVVRDCATRHLVPATTSAHTLRHTFAHRYLAAHPGDLVGLAALLGHASLDTTRIYVEPTAAQLAQRVEQIDLNAYTA
jgi:site-specific recombinase XerD